MLSYSYPIRNMPSYRCPISKKLSYKYPSETFCCIGLNKMDPKPFTPKDWHLDTSDSFYFCSFSAKLNDYVNYNFMPCTLTR